MRGFRKIYCRAFQTVFKLAIPFLPYRAPEILGSPEELAAKLKQKKLCSVLIVTDGFINSGGITKPLKNELWKHGISYTVYDKIVPNPTTDNVEEARWLYLHNKCKAIIGFGGGSAIDCAKAVGARIARPEKQIADMEGILKILKKTPYTVAIPTTAGTGSETTLATVITDSKTRHKFPVNDFSLIPDAAVLDPEVTKSLPPSITASTGMDALTHVVEAYIGRSTVKSTRNASVSALKLIFENLETAYSDGENTEARKNMLNAAYLAGAAFSKSYVGYCHAVAHSLGGRYNIPHGLANAVLLPYVLECYGASAYKKLAKLAFETGLAERGTPISKAAKIFVDKIREMNAVFGIPKKLNGIKEEDIPELSAYADREANPLYPVPKLMDAEELEQLYYDVMEERK